MHPYRYVDPERVTDTDGSVPRSMHEPQSSQGLPPDDDVLLTATQTRARVGGVSAMCIWRWMRDERVRFPAPIRINNRNYWTAGMVRRWQIERAKQSQ